jgi:hypothetical protein
MTLLFWWISYDRKQRWPELEPAIVKANQLERKRIRLLELEQQEEQIRKQDEEYRQQSE